MSRAQGAALVVIIVMVTDLVTKMLSTPVHNDEFAMGIAGADPLWMLVLMAAGIVAFGWLLVRTHAPGWVIGLCLGGALANLADRAVYGSVRDFIVVGNVAFNIADIAILVGLVGWVLSLPRKEVIK